VSKITLGLTSTYNPQEQRQGASAWAAGATKVIDDLLRHANSHTWSPLFYSPDDHMPFPRRLMTRLLQSLLEHEKGFCSPAHR